MTTTIGIKFGRDQPIEGRIGEAAQILVVLLRNLRKVLAADQFLVKLRRQIRLLAERFPLMIELDPELLPNELQRLFRVALVSQQCLPRLNLADEGRVIVSLDPGSQQFLDLIELFRVLQVQGVVVVILLGTRNQPFQRLGAVFRECKVLDVADFVRFESRRERDHQARHQCCKTLHRRNSLNRHV